MDKEIEALGYLAYKRDFIYESKRESLRQEIDSLREFLLAMSKDRELLQGQVKAAHILCKKKLARAEEELQETQDRLRETKNESACLLENKQMEMERLQKERDDALAKVENLGAESCFLKGYGNHLEQKVCALVVKLHEYHQQLQRRTEEVVQTRGRAVNEWEWVRQSMARFENNLLEFQNMNAQLSLEKDHYMKELQGMKQLEGINAGKSNEGLADAEKKLCHATQIIKGLQERVQRLEYSFKSANQRAEAVSSQLNEADATISELQDQVYRLQGQLEALQENNLEFVKEKLEADAATQLREAAISVLRLRIYALEGDLQKERFLRTNKLPDSHLKNLTQFSPDVHVELRARGAKIEKRVKRAGVDGCVYAEAKLGSVNHQLQEDPETVKMLREMNTGLEINLEKEAARGALFHELGSDAWSTKKMKKLEQTLAEAHQRYMLLCKGTCHATKSCGSIEDGSASENTSEIVNEFLEKRDPHCTSTNFFKSGDLTRANDIGLDSQQCLDQFQVWTKKEDSSFIVPQTPEIEYNDLRMPLQRRHANSVITTCT